MSDNTVLLGPSNNKKQSFLIVTNSIIFIKTIANCQKILNIKYFGILPEMAGVQRCHLPPLKKKGKITAKNAFAVFNDPAEKG